MLSLSKNKLIVGAIAAALLLTACSGSNDESTATESTDSAEVTALSGSIDIDGSSTVGPLTDAIAEEYAKVQPGVIVNLAISGTGGGFERFCETGDTQISNASRPIKDSEAEKCKAKGIEFTEIRVGTDALTMVTSSETPEIIQCLTTEEVVSVWGPNAKKNWNQVNSSFPDLEIKVFAPGADSGTYDFMNEDVLDIEQPRQDYNASEDDNIISQGIAGTTGSWGFYGFAYYQNAGPEQRSLQYDAGAGCVAPTVETAQNDTYKMTRPLFIYVRNDALARPEVADFANFYLDTVASVIGEVGYIEAPADAIASAKAALQAAIG